MFDRHQQLCRTSTDKMPIGLWIIGRPFDEATVLKVADAYEHHTQWHLKYPPISGWWPLYRDKRIAERSEWSERDAFFSFKAIATLPFETKTPATASLAAARAEIHRGSLEDLGSREVRSLRLLEIQHFEVSRHSDKGRTYCGLNAGLSTHLSERSLIFQANHTPLNQRLCRNFGLAAFGTQGNAPFKRPPPANVGFGGCASEIWTC
jgi:hypothetical protein